MANDLGLLPDLSRLPLAPSQASGALLLENTGDADAHPVWEVTGPGRNFVAVSPRGEVLAWYGTLEEGVTLTIDTERGTAVDSNGANRYAEFGPAPVMWTIPPGSWEAHVSFEDTSPGRWEADGAPVINLLANPSAEKAGAEVNVYRNLLTNPSAESFGSFIEVRRNLCVYPNAEFGDGTGWSPYRSTLTVTTEQAHSGTRSYKVETPGTQQTEGINLGTSGVLSPNSTAPVTMSAWVLVPAGQEMRLGAEEYGTDGSYISSVGRVNFFGTGAWQRVSVTASLVTATNFMRLYVRTYGDPKAVTFYVDDVLVELAPDLRPYFDGTTLPAIRENLAVDPRARTGVWSASRWFGSGGGTGHYHFMTGMADGPEGTDSYRRKTWTVAGGVGDSGFQINAATGAHHAVANYPAGCPLSVSMRHSSQTSKTARLRIYWRDAAGAPAGPAGGTFVNAGLDTPIAPGAGWVRVSGVLPAAPAGATHFLLVADIVGGSGSWQPGESLDAGALLIGDAGAYFDAHMAPSEALGGKPVWRGATDASPSALVDPDLSVTWVGAQNASHSSLRGAVAVGLGTTSASQCAAVSSTRWSSTGSRSVRLIPLTESTNTLIFLGTGLTTAMNAGLEAGKTYTLLGKLRLTAPQAGVASSRPRTLAVNYGNVPGTATQQYAYSEPAPNVAGVHEVRLTFTLPADTVWARLFAFNGAQYGNGDVWWDDLMLVEGAYYGPYFDGDRSPDPDLTARWEGPAHAAQSVLVGTMPQDWALQSRRCVAIQSRQWSARGGVSARLIVLPTYAGANDTFVDLRGMVPVQPSALAGKKVTLLGTYRTAVPRSYLNGGGNAFRIAVNTPSGVVEPPRIGNGTFASQAGVGEARITVEIPADATTWSQIRPYHGGTKDAPDVWWDDLMLVEGEYTGPYFDGSFTSGRDGLYAWTGAPDASTSTRTPSKLVGASRVAVTWRPRRWLVV